MASLAAAPGDCCLKTVQHTGTARGEVVAIAQVPTYVARPPRAGPAKKIILFFADVYGPLYVNSQLLMDYFAAQGYLVLGIDYFEGDPVSKHTGTPGFVMRDWALQKHQRAKQLLPPWLAAVREQYGGPDTKYAAVGYCFGAPFVMDCVATDWIAAGAFAHPGMLDETHFHKAIQPLLLSCAESDFTFSTENRRKAVDILIERHAVYHVQLFSSVEHGFAVRGDPNVPAQKWAKEESARTVIAWFDRFCN